MSNGLVKRPFGSLGESGMKGLFMACAVLSVITTVGIVLVLISETVTFFTEVSLAEFLFTTDWSPTIKPEIGPAPNEIVDALPRLAVPT